MRFKYAAAAGSVLAACATVAQGGFTMIGTRSIDSFAHMWAVDGPDISAVAVEILTDASGLGFDAPAMAITSQPDPPIGSWTFDGAGGGFALISGGTLVNATTDIVNFDIRFAGPDDGSGIATFDLKYRLWGYNSSGEVQIGAEWNNLGDDPDNVLFSGPFAGGQQFIFNNAGLADAPALSDVLAAIPLPTPLGLALAGLGLLGMGARSRRIAA